MANVFIEESTLTAIGDAIRAKTGATDKIFPADMATAIEGITGGGEGVPDGYVTVTFHYTDQEGQKEFSRLVMAGDNCPDPWVQERIDTPTKGSTAQYDYTFNGWATADGDAADSTALQNITEDKVLYAAFAESVRMYTVTYYDEDGTTVLYTEQVAYGGSSSYEYEKSGHIFHGWTPEPTNITGDLDCYGEWEESLEIANTWDEIIASVNDGTYSTKYRIGQYKPLDLGDEGIVNMQIVCIDESVTYFGATTSSHLTFVAKELLTTSKAYAADDIRKSKYIMYSESSINTYLNETVKMLMPESVRNAIVPMKKWYYYNSGTYETNRTTNNFDAYVWLPSAEELGYTGEGYQAVYSEVYPDNASRIKYLNGTETAGKYLTRDFSQGLYYEVITTGGYLSKGVTNYTKANNLCIGFCI